jgi:hypothetical protein
VFGLSGMQSVRCNAGLRAWWGLCLAALPLLLLPASRAEAQEPVDLQITLFSNGSDPDTIAVAYRTRASNAQVKQDIENLARELGMQPPKVRITRDEGVVAGDARVTGLTNWSQGTVNLDALIHTFRRFGRFRVSCFFMGNFPMRPDGNIERPGLSVQVTANGNTLDHLVSVDQSSGTPARLPTVAPPSGPNWRMAAGIAAIAAIVAGSVFLIVYVSLGHRRASTASEGKT